MSWIGDELSGNDLAVINCSILLQLILGINLPDELAVSKFYSWSVKMRSTSMKF